jgi:hypothetical protein
MDSSNCVRGLTIYSTHAYIQRAKYQLFTPMIVCYFLATEKNNSFLFKVDAVFFRKR